MNHQEALSALLATLASYGCADIAISEADDKGNVWLRIYDTSDIETAEMIAADILKPAGFSVNCHCAGQTMKLAGFDRDGGCAFFGRLLTHYERLERQRQHLLDQAHIANQFDPIKADGIHDLADLLRERMWDLDPAAY